jgi:hypothetical protein
MNDVEYDAALERVRAYARKIRDGEQAVDQESLDRAADLAALYEDKRWIAELEAEGKAPKTIVFRGRPVDPGSKERFSKWAAEHVEFGPRYAKMLLRVKDWISRNAVPIIPPTEWAIRPKQDYAALGRLVEETQNLNQPQKIDLLSSALQLASPGARIQYSDAAKRAIDDLVSVINAETDRVIGIAAS